MLTPFLETAPVARPFLEGLRQLSLPSRAAAIIEAPGPTETRCHYNLPMVGASRVHQWSVYTTMKDATHALLDCALSLWHMAGDT